MDETFLKTVERGAAIFEPVPNLPALNTFLLRVMIERAHGDAEIACGFGMCEPSRFEFVDCVVGRSVGQRTVLRIGGDALQHGDKGFRLLGRQDETGNKNR